MHDALSGRFLPHGGEHRGHLLWAEFPHHRHSPQLSAPDRGAVFLPVPAGGYRVQIISGKINPEALLNEIKVNLNISKVEALEESKINYDKLLAEVKEKALSNYEKKEKEIGNDI